MSDYLQQLFASGRKLLGDTKQPKPSHNKKATPTIEAAAHNLETDPHKIFIKRMITERPKKPEAIKEIKKLILMAEAEL